jgi:hypothetical protein
MLAVVAEEVKKVAVVPEVQVEVVPVVVQVQYQEMQERLIQEAAVAVAVQTPLIITQLRVVQVDQAL